MDQPNIINWFINENNFVCTNNGFRNTGVFKDNIFSHSLFNYINLLYGNVMLKNMPRNI